MVYPGIKDDGQRINLIAYLQTLNDAWAIWRPISVSKISEAPSQARLYDPG